MSCRFKVASSKLKDELLTWSLQLGTCNPVLITHHFSFGGLMRRLHYHRVDVFTDRAFGGNPLAVFANGRGIGAETMQAVAKEFNLSETTFVLPPDDPRHDWRVRIFTPSSELPMAGHPTIGTTFVL